MKSIAFFDIRKMLSKISIPCLIITSEHDNTVSKKIQQEMAEKIPTARQEILYKGGHAIIVEQPELVNQLILDFLINRPLYNLN
jgi:3-oxoadipate enol-lactonase